MAEIHPMRVEVKIQDLDGFKELVAALGAWAEEVAARGSMTSVERALLDAAVVIDAYDPGEQG